MQIERGSTWNIWDFHVHTPYSYLNNKFKFDSNSGEKNEFDYYVKMLFNKAATMNVVAIGVTDYFSIDGYKKIKQEYLSNSYKMKSLFPDDDLREKINRIFVFPNIELRLDTFVGEERCSVNYHVIFSDMVNIIDIEEHFLRRLEITHEAGALTLTPTNIERIGREYKRYNPTERRDDFLVGLEKISVDYKQIKDILNDSAVLQNQYLISIPVDENLCKISWHGRDYSTRRALYQQCNMFMSSNEKTRNWALAVGHEQEQINEFGGIKPCIWGSDAHSYESLFSPTLNRFCWIKAEPTFEGLRQILYEPAERVRIQSIKPEQKNEHQIIDKVIFKSSSDFTSTPIYLSEGLTAIIGGKSTGKSILLSNIAKYLDPKQAYERENISSSRKNNLNIVVEVFWKDGKSDKRKIIYIPQSWLNRVVDDSSSDSPLNDMIQEFLLQREEISKAHDHLKSQISEIINMIRKNIMEYVSTHEKIEECKQKLNIIGGSEAYRTTIKQLEKQRESLSADAGITDDQLKRYTELEKLIAEKTDALKKIEQENEQFSCSTEAFVFIPTLTKIANNDIPTYDFEGIYVVKEQFEKIIHQLNVMLSETWNEKITSLKEVLSQQRNAIIQELLPMKEEWQKLKENVSRNDQIKNIESRLLEERTKLKQAIDLEETKKSSTDKAAILKQHILSSRQAIKKEYENFTSIFLSIADDPDTNLKFEAEIIENKESFCGVIDGIFDKRNSRSFKDKYNLNDSESEINDELFEELWNLMINGTLNLKKNISLKSALEQLFSDWFHVHYIVKSGNDTINSMSPGKKALVLLEMIVNLDNSNCPLLIDQPEDDLDNRSIYNELVQYIRKKKHERQIIVVTHNANVVIGADAEEVIIANQDGKDMENHSNRFEYRCGAIENISPMHDENGEILSGILNKKGIQQQICDILEGGKDAFNLRQRKYLGINQ